MRIVARTGRVPTVLPVPHTGQPKGVPGVTETGREQRPVVTTADTDAPADTPATEASYNADDIVHLDGLDAVRKRPRISIGSGYTKGFTSSRA
jgi:hypothetical protein